MRRSTCSPIRRGLRTGALLVIIGMVFSANADEQKINRLDSLKVTETAQATEIVISGSAPPTFTVFKLTGPTRLFIDISNADISSITGPVEVENGVISQITPLQFTDELVRIGRLVIGLETDAIYDVKARGNNLVITVDATQRKPEVAVNAKTAADLAAAQARAEQAEARARNAEAAASTARQQVAAAEAKARAAEAQAQQVAAQAREQAQTSEKRATEAEARSQALSREVQSARETAANSSSEARSSAEAKVADAEKRAQQAEATAQAARAEANAAATVASTRIEAADARTAEAEARARASEARVTEGQQGTTELNKKAQRLAETAQAAVERAERAETALEAARNRMATAEQQAQEATRSASAQLAAAEQRAAAAEKRATAATESANAKVAQAEAKARQAEVTALKEAERAKTQANAAESRANTAERKASALIARAAKARDEAIASNDTLRDSAEQTARAAEGRAEAAATKAQAARAQASAAAEAANARALAAEARAKEAEARAKAAEAQAQESGEVAKRSSNQAERLAKNAEAAEKRARQAESNLESLHGQLSQAQAQIDRSESELASAAKRTRNAQKNLDEAKNAAERANARASLAESKISEAKTAERAAKVRATAADQRAATASRASESASALAEKLRKQVQSEDDDRLANKAEAAARAAAAEARATQLEADRAQLTQKVRALEADRSQARAVIENMTAERAQLDQKLVSSKKKNDSARTQALEAEQRANDAAVALERAKVAQIESAQAASRLHGQLKALEARATRAQEAKSTTEVEALNRQLATARERASQLEVAVQEGQAELTKARQLSEQRTTESDALRARLERSQRTQVAKTPAPKPVVQPKAEAPAKRPMLPPPPPQMRSRVVNVKFTEGTKHSQIEVFFEGRADYSIRQEGARTRILELKNMLIDPAIERSLDTSEFGGAVQLVSSFQAPPPGDRVRIVVTLNEKVKDKVTKKGGRLFWKFDRPARTIPTVGALPPPPTWTAPKAPLASGSEVRYEQPRAALFTGLNQAIATRNDNQPAPTRRKRYSGRKINIDIKDGDIHNILRLLAKEGNINIVTSDEVDGTITMHLKLVPWDQALDIILRTKGLDMVRENDIIRVAPIESIAKEREAELKKQEVKEKLKPLEVKLITVNHASASDLMPRVKSVLSKRGTSEFDDRTNTVILKDVDDHLDAAEDMIRRLDTQTPQVLIETRIVEVNEVNVQQFGIQWGVDSTYSAATGNPTGLRFPSSIGIAGGADDQQGSNEGVSTNPNYVVNLPASAGLGSGGALGLSFGSIDSTFNLNVRLTALENRGSVKIVSSPKITTLDNKQAEISQGVSIPISQVSASGIQTVFFDAVLALRVTPHVTQDGNIYLKLNAQNNTPDFQNVGARGDPTILKKEAKTELLLKDGDTTVIGGIYTSNAGFNRSEVPYLARIPILGAMFRNHQESDRRSELLIFVTPRIVNRAASQVRTSP